VASLVYDGNIKVTWCATIINIAAPTTTELNNGTSLESWIVPDGLDIGLKDASVDTSTLKSVINSAKPGRADYTLAIEYLRDDSSDVAWNLFVRGTVGFLAVRDNLDSSVAWASGQKVGVYPLTAGSREKSKIAINKRQTAKTQFFPGGSAGQVPNESAVVA
jgi:hypothetical protein